MLTNLVDGIAYGMLLYVLAIGLSVTLGLMNVINLAHGAFAMAGGYVALVLVNRLGVPFLAALPLVFVAIAILGLVAEQLLYVHVYQKSHLDQVLFTIGLVFMSVSAVNFFVGPTQQFINLPDFLKGRLEFMGVAIGVYRAFIIAVCGVLAIALQFVFARTRFGARLRAGVDNRDVARGLGINVGLVFALTFAAGSGLAGLGGALGAELLGLDSGFPLKFMVYFLIVVTIGGTTSLTGPLVAALVLGVADVAGKYYVPSFGGFLIYTVMVAMLIWRPHGLFARSDGR